jgi:hypothetical protein
MENSVSKAIEKAQQFSGYLELKEYQRQTIEKPIYLACRQWRSQPGNLVPLCKFKIIIIIHFFRNLLFSQSMNTKIFA